MSGVVAALIGNAQFWPRQLFSGSVQGAWYDPSDLSTLFQDSAGTTAVTAVEQPVGKMLDKSGNGNHATQATSAARPTLRARYNLATYSEDWTQTPYQSGNRSNVTTTANYATDPNGGNTATRMEGTSSTWFVGQTVTLPANGSVTLSFWVKSNTGSNQTFRMFGNGTVTIGSDQTATSSWQRFTYTYTSTATSQQCGIIQSVSGGTADLLVWGFQILTENDVTTTGNAYQSITTSTSYTTGSPFRTYLEFDGVDDSMASSSIDISSSDKATIFSASTKFQDASLGVLYEFSANINTNAGSFHHVSPLSDGYQISTVGSSILTGTLTSYVAPYTAVITHGMDIGASSAATELIPRVNAASPSVSYSGSAGTGNFGNYPLYIGMRGGASFPFKGRLYGLLFRGAASSTFEIASTERWLNGKTGAY